MLLSALLFLALATPVPVVTIYVGPDVKDGFVDVDRAILDSIKDVQGKLRKDKSLYVVDRESDAQIRLYVVGRGIGGITGDGSSVRIGTTDFQFATKARYVAAFLRVGSYERPFIAEDLKKENWKRCAEILAGDISTWVSANRTNIAANR